MGVKPVFALTVFLALLTTTAAFAENAPKPANSAGLPNAPTVHSQTSLGTSTSSNDTAQVIPRSKRQPTRILGIMPNYRAVSAGAHPPPATPKEAFRIATYNSFDYSAFIFTGLTSAIAEGTNTHPQLGKGIPGFYGYYWRGFLDKADGNYWVVFILPTVFREDERYYALGEGSIFKRAFYAASRIAITPDYHGHNTVNASELLGRGVAQGISVAYYPSQDTSAGSIASKYAYALLRDAATNTFREFWPDISAHVLHQKQ